MVWNNITGKDECWHCGSEEHNTAGHMHGKTPSTPHPIAPAGDADDLRRLAQSLSDEKGQLIHSLESLRAENARLRESKDAGWAIAKARLAAIAAAWDEGFAAGVKAMQGGPRAFPPDNPHRPALAPQPGSESQKKGDG